MSCRLGYWSISGFFLIGPQYSSSTGVHISSEGQGVSTGSPGSVRRRTDDPFSCVLSGSEQPDPGSSNGGGDENGRGGR